MIHHTHTHFLPVYQNFSFAFKCIFYFFIQSLIRYDGSVNFVRGVQFNAELDKQEIKSKHFLFFEEMSVSQHVFNLNHRNQFHIQLCSKLFYKNPTRRRTVTSNNLASYISYRFHNLLTELVNKDDVTMYTVYLKVSGVSRFQCV